MMDQCADCGKPMRYGNTPAAEAPGTVRGFKTLGLCVTCSRHRNSAERPKTRCLRTCQTCRRQMRPDKTLKKDWPGTVAPVSKTCCVSCHEKAQRGLPAWEIEARRIKVPPVSEAEKAAATRVVIAAGGDTMILNLLGLARTHAEVR